MGKRKSYRPRDPVSYPSAYLELRRAAIAVYLEDAEAHTLLTPLAHTQEAATDKEVTK